MHEQINLWCLHDLQTCCWAVISFMICVVITYLSPLFPSVFKEMSGLHSPASDMDPNLDSTVPQIEAHSPAPRWDSPWRERHTRATNSEAWMWMVAQWIASNHEYPAWVLRCKVKSPCDFSFLHSSIIEPTEYSQPPGFGGSSQVMASFCAYSKLNVDLGFKEK